MTVVETSCPSEGGLGFVLGLLTKTEVFDYRNSNSFRTAPAVLNYLPKSWKPANGSIQQIIIIITFGMFHDFLNVVQELW